MSFSLKVKEEISREVPSARHCCIAELAAIISFSGEITNSNTGGHQIKITTENLTVARKYFILLKNTFHVKAEISVKRNVALRKNNSYCVLVRTKADVEKILLATKLVDDSIRVSESLLPSVLVAQNTCCKRAFIRGAFLASGSISDPAKTYHFEIVTMSPDKAAMLSEMIHFFEIDSKIVVRKKYFVVYIKEGSQIVDLLNIMEAHVALMDLENVRILKEMRNSINRKVNCETANINKTVIAATKQIEDIIFIRDTIGLSELTEGLEDVATLRIERPDMSLKELGAMLNPPIGKSGVNHRLRKISKIADSLREQKEE
ncbi:DNA-binding protein WhiA [Anaeromicropila populeti]|uniref:Probable cell division protein WhiA n=1 Tax=Anaeromicropila populeti TaxID=37658 RepID=A0A1I6JYL0_9FIRM|nr:DNA-binding protein WhiA [Anaeromicropila populeti]SFR84052.1 hypothetical protein SAMN05661086_02090 [Anaeromicropila populeti]